MGATKQRVHSICTRDNAYFDIFRDALGIKTENLFKMIHKDVDNLSRILAQKGVKYSSLKSVLIPSNSEKKECIILCFEVDFFGNRYGEEIYDLFFPLLDKAISHVIKVGDILYDDYYYVKLAVLDKNINYSAEKKISRNKDYFLVYINNLSSHESTRIIEELKHSGGFIGYYDGSFKDVFCDFIANSLVQLCLQYKSIVVLPHTDVEYKDSDNVNMRGVNFDKYGFKYISVSEYYYNVYLTYQIPTNYVDEEDITNSLAALTTNPNYFGDYKLVITEEKYCYCIHHNEAKMKASLIGNLSYDDFVDFINNNLQITNIYSLEFKEQYNVGTFVTIFEYFNPNMKKYYRFLVSFAYNSEEKTLKLITMY